MEKSMLFYKYHGCGNDFIMLDSRIDKSSLTTAMIEKMCHRRFGVGADGLIELSNSETFDFSMKYYNSDGRESSFCGNGARCIVRFAYDLGLVKKSAQFEFNNSVYFGEVLENAVQLKMQNVDELISENERYIIDTGSPHYMEYLNNLNEIDLIAFAHKIRYSDRFPEGINVNIVKQLSDDTIEMRTYERGVEDETYSCGTGVTAAAISFSHKRNNTIKEVNVKTKGGEFSVLLNPIKDRYEDIYLIGPATFVYKGEFVFK